MADRYASEGWLSPGDSLIKVCLPPTANVNTKCSCQAHDINQNSNCYENNILSNIIRLGKQIANTFPKLNIKCIETELRNIAFNLGNSSSQTDTTVISSIPIDITDLQKKINDLEKKLYESNFQLHHLRQQNILKPSLSDISDGSHFEIVDNEIESSPSEKSVTFDTIVGDILKINKDKTVYQVRTTNTECNTWIPSTEINDDEKFEIDHQSEIIVLETNNKINFDDQKPAETDLTISSIHDNGDVILNQNDLKDDTTWSNDLTGYAGDFSESSTYLRSKTVIESDSTILTETGTHLTTLTGLSHEKSTYLRSNTVIESDSTILTETGTDLTTLTGLSYEKSKMDKRHCNVRQYKIKSADLETNALEKSNKSRRNRYDACDAPKNENRCSSAKKEQTGKTSSNTQDRRNRRSSKPIYKENRYQHEDDFLDIILKDSYTTTDIQSHTETDKCYSSQNAISYKDLLDSASKYGSNTFGVSKNNNHCIENYSVITQLSDPVCRDTDQRYDNILENDIVMAKEICSCCTSKSKIVSSDVAESLYPKDHGKVDEGPDSFYKKVNTKIAGRSNQVKSPHVERREEHKHDTSREHASKTNDSCDSRSVWDEKKSDYDTYNYTHFEELPVNHCYRFNKRRPSTGNGQFYNHFEPGVHFDEDKYCTRSVRDVSNYKMGVNDKYSIVNEMKNRFPLLENLSMSSSDNSIDTRDRTYLSNHINQGYPFPGYPKIVQRNHSGKHIYRNDRYSQNNLRENNYLSHYEHQNNSRNLNRNIRKHSYDYNEPSVNEHHRQFSDNPNINNFNIDPEDLYTNMLACESGERYSCNTGFSKSPYNERKLSPELALSDQYSYRSHYNIMPLNTSQHQRENNHVAGLQSGQMFKINSRDKILKIRGILSTCLKELESGDLERGPVKKIQDESNCQCCCNCEIHQCNTKTCNTDDVTDTKGLGLKLKEHQSTSVKNVKISHKSDTSCLISHKNESDNGSLSEREKNVCKSKITDRKQHNEAEPLMKKSHKHSAKLEVEHKVSNLEISRKSGRDVSKSSRKMLKNNESEYYVSDAKKNKSSKSGRDESNDVSDAKKDKSNKSGRDESKSSRKTLENDLEYHDVSHAKKDKSNKSGRDESKSSRKGPEHDLVTPKETFRNVTKTSKHRETPEELKVLDSSQNKGTDISIKGDRTIHSRNGYHNDDKSSSPTKNKSGKESGENSRRSSLSKNENRQRPEIDIEKSLEDYNLESINTSSSTMVTNKESSEYINKQSKKYLHGNTKSHNRSNKIETNKNICQIMLTETSDMEEYDKQESSKPSNSTLYRSNESSECINKESTKKKSGKKEKNKSSKKEKLEKNKSKIPHEKSNILQSDEKIKNIFKYFYKKKLSGTKTNKNIFESKDSVDNLFPLPIPVIKKSKDKKNKKDVICLNVSHIVYPQLMGEDDNMKTVFLYNGNKKDTYLADRNNPSYSNLSSQNTSTSSIHNISKSSKRERNTNKHSTSDGVILPLEMSQMYINCIDKNYTKNKSKQHKQTEKCVLKKVVKKIKAMNELSMSHEKLGHKARERKKVYQNFPIGVQRSRSLQYILKNKDAVDYISKSLLNLSSEKRSPIYLDKNYKIKKKLYASPKQILLDSMNISSQPLTNKFEKLNLSFNKNNGESNVFSLLNKTIMKNLKKVGVNQPLIEAKTQTSKSDIPKKRNLFQQILKPNEDIHETKATAKEILTKPTTKEILTGKTVKLDNYTKQIRNIFWYPKEYEKSMESKKSKKPRFFEVQHKMPVSSMLKTLQGKELPKFGLPKLSPV